MELWEIMVALVQGLLEWLPVSSEGHVILIANIVGGVSAENALALAVWLHLGSAAAVMFNFRKEVFNLISLRNIPLLRQLVLATLATAITAVPIYIWLRESVTTFQGQMINLLIGLLLIATSMLLYMTMRQRVSVTEEQSLSRPIDERRASITGLVQGLAVLPGLSRSALTVSSLLLQRVEKVRALRFSFLMSVPAVVGILFFDVLTGNVGTITTSFTDLVLMEVIVFVVSILSMRILIRLATRVEFWRLCLILGVIAVVLGLSVMP